MFLIGDSVQQQNAVGVVALFAFHINFDGVFGILFEVFDIQFVDSVA
jgi:hypothetical protein